MGGVFALAGIVWGLPRGWERHPRWKRILKCLLHNTRRLLNVIYRQRMRMRLLQLLII